MAPLTSILHRFHLPIILTIFLGIILLSSINTTHDWGGDFAQYLNNARDLVEGTKGQEVEVLDHQNFTPRSRGAGFSLLLAIFYPLFQESIAPYTVFISLCLVIASIGMFQFFKQKGLPSMLSLILVLIFALHPYVLAQKFEILPTFPFLILLLVGFQVADQSNIKSTVILGVVVGLMISFRNVGWVFIAAVLIHGVFDLFKSFRGPTITRLLLILLISQTIDLLIKWIVFGNLSFENLSWYDSVFTPTQMWLKFQENLLYYYDLIHLYFHQHIFQFRHTLYEKLFLILVLLGFLTRLRNWKLSDTFFLLYLMLIMTYFWQSGMRFLVPVLPMILAYLGLGIHWMLDQLTQKGQPARYFLGLILPVLFLSGQANESIAVAKRSKTTQYGPQTQTAKEAFTFIRNHTDPYESITFHKPWVLHHYTGRVSMAINPKNGMEGFSMDYLVDKMRRFKVENLLIAIDPKDHAIYNPKLVRAISHDTRFTERWRNDAFVFLSLNDDIIVRNSALE